MVKANNERGHGPIERSCYSIMYTHAPQLTFCNQAVSGMQNAACNVINRHCDTCTSFWYSYASRSRSLIAHTYAIDVKSVVSHDNHMLAMCHESHLYNTEEVGHDFRGMCILLSRIISNVLFIVLLSQRVDLGCMGVHCSLW